MCCLILVSYLFSVTCLSPLTDCGLCAHIQERDSFQNWIQACILIFRHCLRVLLFCSFPGRFLYILSQVSVSTLSYPKQESLTRLRISSLCPAVTVLLQLLIQILEQRNGVKATAPPGSSFSVWLQICNIAEGRAQTHACEGGKHP